MSLLKECVSGVKHDGTAEGTIVKMGKWDVYFALPKNEYPKDKAILLFTGTSFITFKRLNWAPSSIYMRI